MHYQNREAYTNQMDNLSQVGIKDFEQKDFYEKCDNKMLVLHELKQFEKIQKSYNADPKLKASDFYSSFTFLNAVIVVQQNMGNLKKIFESNDELYGVWLWKQGLEKLVIVDDQIPCKLSGNYPHLATIISEYQWPIILEKAIGKMLGLGYNSFKALKNDSIEFYLQVFFLKLTNQMITGQLIHEQEFQSFEDLEKKLKDKSNILFVKYQQDSKSIASVITTHPSDGQDQLKLIKLIAPNSESVYFQGRQKDDSVCYLSWEEFKTNFQSVHVLQWKDDYIMTAISLENPIERKTDIIEHTYSYKFKIENQGNYQCTLWQKDFVIEDNEIIIRSQNNKKQIGLLRVLLFQELESNQYKFIDGQCDFQCDISINALLEKGEYLILCQAYFNNFGNDSQEPLQKYFDLNFSIKGEIANSKIYPDDQFEQKKINLIKSLIQHTLAKDKKRSIISSHQQQINVYTNQIYGFLYFYYENRGTIDIQEQIEFKEQGYLIRYDSLKKENQVLVEVKQNCFQILLYTLDPEIINKSENTNFQYQYTHALVGQCKHQIGQWKIHDQIRADQYTQKIVCDQFIAYINQNHSGITMQFQNNHEQDVSLELQFTELKNLRLAENPQCQIDGSSIYIQLQKKTEMQIYFQTNEPQQYYGHKITLEITKLN
ncbi:unnamed protein product (macronuclear) [Paramecium tetraurelia]|uniref:Calpain catalytic domain-containing protein n=1 Tax=Paramecium tetraurelia TaxID=5888 RepID=A0BW01_PARTE|nr:uncharacterized protein GSPATT00032570001 [Paramecium tetraurelia]CAK62718.1 unnamed protein product [Paramecium tetraurelia]|eukprot:XP_001430116.1 hypothetical protein (macronuclear) [Paramecium tetraurelia strain d4-2]